MVAAEGRQRIDVAVAILQREDGHVLWCQRPEGKPYAGYWEFPGGKLEVGETPWQALVREIHEELGIEALEGGPWFVIEHDYPHALVRLHLYRVWRFSGEPQAREGQAFCWDAILPKHSAAVSPILPATEPVLPRMALPSYYLLSDIEAVGLRAYCRKLIDFSKKFGYFLLQLREFSMSPREQVRALEWLLGIQAEVDMHLVIHASCDAALELALSKGVNKHVGLHLPERLLASQDERFNREHWLLQTAATHSVEAMNQAFVRGVDAVVLGTVLQTPSHPEKTDLLGWNGFGDMAKHAKLPVYAVGGMLPELRLEAAKLGAHGLAMQRAIHTVC